MGMGRGKQKIFFVSKWDSDSRKFLLLNELSEFVLNEICG
jgi:hypothetical protein